MFAPLALSADLWGGHVPDDIGSVHGSPPATCKLNFSKPRVWILVEDSCARPFSTTGRHPEVPLNF